MSGKSVESPKRKMNILLNKLEKRRKKIKKIVDTRSSKGRKSRFITIPKLVNFHPAKPEIKWMHERRNELFKSLFL
uniref:Apoptosis-antagonizing transcription factor C-terminal domain-containing protein n=1 Tax=Acrobeloides nanus TaxID=290746 RepID=A0A914D8J9_9BILA